MGRLLRFLLAVMLLPALVAPQGLALAWCACTAETEACCAEEPESRGCCRDADEGACSDEGCEDCIALEIDGPEPLLVEGAFPVELVLGLWCAEPAVLALDAGPRPEPGAARAPPLRRAQAGPGSGVLPLRI